MHFTQIELPTGRDELVGCYMYLTAKLRALWVEYVNFIETIYTQESSFLYRIVFSEMDFYEGLRLKVEAQLPKKLVNSLRKLDDYSGW